LTNRGRNSGVTLIEMLIVVTIIAIMAGISFPAITAGLAGVRLASASGSVASFLTSAMNNVDRHEVPAALVISPGDSTMSIFTAASGDKAERTLPMPQGIRIEGDEPARYLFMPGGTVPHVTVVLRNDKGARRSVQIDPTTGVPDIRRVETQP
jgi:prepilin-type N-terminal cleavage/methylation domain-containing protein